MLYYIHSQSKKVRKCYHQSSSLQASKATLTRIIKYLTYLYITTHNIRKLMETFLQILNRYVTYNILNKHKLEKNTHQSHSTKPPITTIEINIPYPCPPMPMGFGWAWVQYYCSWVGIGFVHPYIHLQIKVKLLRWREYANQEALWAEANDSEWPFICSIQPRHGVGGVIHIT